ncbi:reverse transcriptase domain-containing protein [Tanacetum coccineum]
MLRACPHHGFTELTQVDTFYNGLNDNEQDSLNATAGGNLLSKTTREALNIIENKSKVRYSRNRSNASRMNATSSKTDERIDKLADQLSTLVEIVSKKVVTPAPVKAVEESCVTCGGAHSWYNCPATDNNQASVCATTGTYNQVNPPNRVSNQMAPPGFAPVQNNGQNRFNQNHVQGNNFNRGNNFHGNQGFQNQNNHAPNFQNQGFQNQPFQVPNNQVQQEISNDFSSYKRNNDQMLRNMQSQINSLKGDLKNEIQNTMKTQQTVLMNQQNAFQNNLQNMLSGFFQNQASTSGTLPSNTIPNPKCEMKAIIPKWCDYEGPSISNNPSPLKGCGTEENEETKDKEQTNLPRFAPTIKNLLMNKEKLFELAKIPLNENCSAMLLKKLPEKLGDPGKFLIPCDFPGMDVCHALADLGASINLMPLSIWKKLSLPELTPTRMTLELADRSITRPKGLAEDVFVKVGSFHFPTDFVVVDFEADPRVPLILGRSFLRTGRALIDVYEGELILRNGDERLIFHVDKHPQKHANESIKMINFIDVSCKDSFGEVLRLKKSNHFSSGSTTPLSDSRPSLISFETSDSLLEEFADELALLDPFPPGNEDVDFEADLREIELLLNRDPSTDFSPKISLDTNPERFTNGTYDLFAIASTGDINPIFNEILEDVESKDSNVSNFDVSVLLNTPLFDKDECFDPRGKIDKIDAFMDAYNDSEGDVLEILHNTIRNLFHGVFLDQDQRSLKDEPDNDDLMTKDKVFDPRIWEKILSPSIVRLSFKDCHCLFFTIVIQSTYLTLSCELSSLLRE